MMTNSLVSSAAVALAVVCSSATVFTCSGEGVARKARDYKLVWQDDFDGTGLNTNLWSLIPEGESDWDRHMSVRSDLVQVRDGVLELWGKRNTDTNADPRPFVTGGVASMGKATVRNGKIEMRVKFEDHQKGAWPALWLLQNEKDGQGRGYPWGGEIDVVERLNGDKFVYHTVHSGWTLNKKHPHEPAHGGRGAITCGDWHVYGMEITPDELRWSVDGKVTFTYARTPNGDPDQYPFDRIPYYLLIDMQLGGKWVGQVKRETLPVRMWVDWVRAYEPVVR